MGRSGYSDDCDGFELGRWRAAVRRSIKGKRGQAFLRELLEVLGAMPEKRLIENELEAGGEFCTLGAIGRARGLSMSGFDPTDRGAMARAYGIAGALVAEIMFENDGGFRLWPETAEARWARMREWVAQQIAEEPKP